MSRFSLLAAALLVLNPAADRAQAHWDAGEFEAAAEAWAAAYAETGEIGHLYARGQAQLMAGQCEEAVRTLEAFIATEPKADWIDAAEASMEECRKQLPPPAEPVPDPPPPEAIEPASLAPATEVPATEVPATEVVAEPPARPWYRDPAGAALTGAGAAGLVAGATLAIVARSKQSSAAAATDVDDYGRNNDQAVSLSRVSVPVLAVGGALLVGGIVRYVLVARRKKKLRAPASDARQQNPLTVRF